MDTTNALSLGEYIAASPPLATRQGWQAFDEGWSSHSNPYAAGTPEADEWAYAWYEAESHHRADLELAAGADPEDFK